jgi:O-antigen ligase
MHENLRALIVILILATPFFYFARQPACGITSAENFTRRRNLWFGLTLAAFLAFNFWLYLAIATPLLIYANRRESNPTALFFFLLFLLPSALMQIPGMGVINYIFDISHARLLALLILLPAFFSLRRQGNHVVPFGKTGTDKAFIAYLFLSGALFFREDSMTNGIRHVFYLFIDVFLPYFVISRSLKDLQSFRDTLLSAVLAIMVLAPLAIFETIKGWLLYSSLIAALDLRGVTEYLARDGMLRAIVTATQPIVLGYLMAAGIGFYLFVQRFIQHKFVRRLGMAVLVAGLIAPVSRGPWVGATVLLIVFIITGRNPARRLMGLALAVMVALPLVTAFPKGERMINMLPFIGTTDKGSVDYRQDLLTNSMIVIQRNPWFGSIDFRDTPELESMRQGQGIIDIVNSYITITLENGLVGLALFIGFFALTLLGIYRAMRLIPDKDSEEYLLGRALLATQLAILVIIYTVSSISFIPIMYWSVAGLGVAYAQMVRKNRENEGRVILMQR